MLIELYDQLRKNLIEINDFYLEQCQLKLLNQFDNISQEADEYEEKWRIEKESHYFNKDPYDSSSLYYDSYDASIIFYQNLSDLQQNVRFSVIAGMYHRWEKQFRSFLHNQSRWWGCTHQVRNEIWTLPVNKLFMLFKTDEFDIEKQEFFKDFDACRVIVNVFKHGNGSSYRELCNKYPFYLKKIIMVWKIIRCLTLYMNLHLILRMMTLLNFQRLLVNFGANLKILRMLKIERNG